MHALFVSKHKVTWKANGKKWLPGWRVCEWFLLPKMYTVLLKYVSLDR